MGRLLFAAGLAAQHQIGVEVLITIMSLLTHQIMLNPSDSGTNIDIAAFWDSHADFLKWAYLLGAIGLALTGGEHINSTAKELKRAANSMRLGHPKNVLGSLIVQLSVTLTLLAVIFLRGPPELLVRAASLFGSASAVPVLWAATISIGVASCGATVHAAVSALGLSRESR